MFQARSLISGFLLEASCVLCTALQVRCGALRLGILIPDVIDAALVNSSNTSPEGIEGFLGVRPWKRPASNSSQEDLHNDSSKFPQNPQNPSDCKGPEL